MDRSKFDIDKVYCTFCGAECVVGKLKPRYGQRTGNLLLVRAKVKCPKFRWWRDLFQIKLGHTNSVATFGLKDEEEIIPDIVDY